MNTTAQTKPLTAKVKPPAAKVKPPAAKAKQPAAKAKQPKMAANRPKPTYEEIMNTLQQMNEVQSSRQEQLSAEMSSLRQELGEVKEIVSRFKPVQSGGRGSLGRRKKTPITVEEPPKTALPIQDLLPLLPQLVETVPQLKKMKVAESMKLLSNPVVMNMIQQFIANGGLKLLKTKALPEPAESRRRRA
ncbi:hypothetical protein ACI7RC_17380 [Brevibacillus sp. B_LB10_24]|uniref:hypothetical protein n=1 Tax=Brevibacillus sp. B_LB10_24 TaxID=3380645 RepID=UPI0038BDACAB